MTTAELIQHLRTRVRLIETVDPSNKDAQRMRDAADRLEDLEETIESFDRDVIEWKKSKSKVDD